MEPLVSVIIPVWNRAHLVGETLESVRAQTMPRWEALVVDDGSTDATASVVAAQAGQDPRVRLLLRRGRRGGAGRARNQGVEAATASLVVFLDSDDLLAPSCLEKRVDHLSRQSSADLVVVGCRLFDHVPGDRVEHWNTLGGDSLSRFLALDAPWTTAGPLWRREALHRVGSWREGDTIWDDWDFHVRALARDVKAQEVLDVDHHYRAPRPESHSAKGLEPSYMTTHRDMLNRAGTELSRGGHLTSARRALLAGAHFRMAWEFRLRGGVSAALRMWLASRRWCRVSGARLLYGLVHLLPDPERPGRGNDVLSRRWPEYTVGSGTFLRAPSIDPEAAAVHGAS